MSSGNSISHLLPPHFCSGCGLPQTNKRDSPCHVSLKRCARCRNAWYHNAKCQKQHYAAHKPFCKADSAVVACKLPHPFGETSDDESCPFATLPAAVKRQIAEYLNAQEATRLACTCRGLRCVELLDPTQLLESQGDFTGGYTICPRRWQWIPFRYPLSIHTCFVKGKLWQSLQKMEISRIELIGTPSSAGFPYPWEYSKAPPGKDMNPDLKVPFMEEYVPIFSLPTRDPPHLSTTIASFRPNIPEMDYSLWYVVGGSSSGDNWLHVRSLSVRELVYVDREEIDDERVRHANQRRLASHYENDIAYELQNQCVHVYRQESTGVKCFFGFEGNMFTGYDAEEYPLDHGFKPEDKWSTPFSPN